VGVGEDEKGSDVSGSNGLYRGRAEPVLDSPSDLYSDPDSISVGVSGLSSSPT